jgi:hypothetical protein
MGSVNAFLLVRVPEGAMPRMIAMLPMPDSLTAERENMRWVRGLPDSMGCGDQF